MAKLRTERRAPRDQGGKTGWIWLMVAVVVAGLLVAFAASNVLPGGTRGAALYEPGEGTELFVFNGWHWRTTGAEEAVAAEEVEPVGSTAEGHAVYARRGGGGGGGGGQDAGLSRVYLRTAEGRFVPLSRMSTPASE